MTNGWQTVQLGDVLRRVKKELEIDDSVTYKQVTVRLWNKGVILRGEQDGIAIKTKRQFLVKTDQLLMSRIDVRNGAIGLVPKELDGAIVSNDFWVYDFDESKLFPKFLAHYVTTPGFLEDANRTSSGTTKRIRAEETAFLNINIPLPSLEEQHRIVEHVEVLAAHIAKAKHLRYQSSEESELLVRQSIWKIFSDGENENKYIKRLGDICEFQGGSQPPKSLFAYEPLDGYIRLIQIRDYKSENYLTYVPKDSVTRFCSSEDIMIGRYGPPVFQILRGIEGAYNVAIMKTVPDETVLSKSFLYYLLQEPIFHKKIVDDSQRTSGQTGIRKELLQDHMVYVPPLDEQRRIVAYLDSVQARLAPLRELQSQTGEELDALLPSVLDMAFKGEL